MMFLHSCPNVKATHDYEAITEKALNTYVLGEFVGSKWGLPSVMKWRPVVHGDTMDPQDVVKLGRDASWSVGLYKVSGTTVEAVVGGVFHQFVRLLFHDIRRIVCAACFSAPVTDTVSVLRAAVWRTGSSTHGYYPIYFCQVGPRDCTTHSTDTP
jgi:hypothetical protein